MTRRPSTATILASLACAWFAPATAQAQPQPVQLVATGSEIVFVIRQMGVQVEGRFTRFGAQIALDPRKPEAGSVSLNIDAASARFGSAEVDAELPKPTWLDAARFAQARFQSSSIKAAGPGRFEVAGKLSIKGSVRDIVVPVQITQAGATSQASGSFTIKRLDFKVGEAEWADTSMLANEVQVRFKLALAGLAPL